MKIFNCRRCQQPTDRILRRASDGTSPRLAGVRAVSCMIFHFSIPNTDSNIQEFGEEKNSGLWNVVVKYIAVFLSIFLLESVWIWTKTNRCFRCQGAWLWVTYSPGKKYSVCLCPNMHIHICWEASKIGTWECGWLVFTKDSTNQERRKENTCWASAEGSHCISRKPSPLIFTPSLQGSAETWLCIRLRDSQPPAVA